MVGHLRSAYGHACAVNFDWPWCPPAPRGRAADLRIQLGGLGPFADGACGPRVLQGQRPARDPSLPPVVRVERGGDGHLRVDYADGAAFAIDPSYSEIFGVTGGQLTDEDLLVYLQGPILGFVLRLRGVTCLHASAAVADGRAFAVVGGAGMGKSTSAAVLAQLGLEVLTDDVLVLRERGGSFDVEPGLPRVLLWPESVGQLFGHPDALPRIVSTWGKRYLDLTRPGYRFAREAAPLEAVYLLGERLPAGAAPQITPLEGARALAWLLAHTYANDFLDTRMRIEELEVLGRVASQVPIRLLRAPDDRASVRAACEAVIADFRGLG
jgi:hypothetical protein